MAVIEERIPKHVQLRDLLREKATGEHKPGDRFYSEPDLIREYNLSNTTVQKAIGALVREGLLTRIQGKGTFIARHSTLTHCNIIIGKDAFHKHSYYFDIIRGIEIVASTNGIDVAIQTYDSRSSDFSLGRFVKRMASNPSSGTVMVPPADPAKIKDLSKSKHPVVVIGNYPEYPELHSVGVDTYNGTFRMAEHLIESGHKKVALVGGLHTKSQPEIDFLRGYKEALVRHGIPVREDWILESEWLEEEGYRLTKDILESDERPDAIFAGDDTIALGVIKALSEESIKIPDEVAVAGFNDLDLATIVNPNLTTMKVPRLDMGMAACEMLLKLARREEIPQKQMIFQAELLVRESA